MKSPITEHTFYKYMKCPAWVERDFRDGDVREPLLQKLHDEGLLREHELKLIASRKAVEVDTQDLDEAALRTLELMKKGTQSIYKGVLAHGHYIARPDVLERVEGRSKLGDWYYVAADLKRSHLLKDEYKMQGAFYAEVLKKIQGVRPMRGYVIHATGERSVYELDEFEPDFRLSLDAIERLYQGDHEEHFLTSGYKQSPYFEEFYEEVRACDHLSLLNRVWRSEVRALEDAGIKTVEDLANANVEKLKHVRELTMDRLYFLQQQAISMKENRVIVVGAAQLPEPQALSLIVDIESDPLRDADYLFGVLKVQGDESEYHSFFADTPEEEEKNWHEFTAFLNEYADAYLYHYGWFEVDVFRRLAERYGAPDRVKEQFENRMVDLLTAMREHVIFPMPFYSLKDIAKHLGFRWRTQDASGLDSILWYEDWLVGGDEAAKRRIIEYNEDDVRATWFVHEWAMKNVAG